MSTVLTASHRRVIFASSLGTVFEWYDFFLYGSLAGVISAQFFSGVNETTGFIFALAERPRRVSSVDRSTGHNWNILKVHLSQGRAEHPAIDYD